MKFAPDLRRPPASRLDDGFSIPDTQEEALAEVLVVNEARWAMSPRVVLRQGASWTAYCPSVPGITGTGTTRRAAQGVLDLTLEQLAALLRGERPRRTREQQGWVDAVKILSRCEEILGHRDWVATARALTLQAEYLTAHARGRRRAAAARR